MHESTTDRFADKDPWDVWQLTPYQPDPRPPILVNVELSAGGFTAPTTDAPERPKIIRTIVAEHRVLCDKRMRAVDKRERGKFGRRSPSMHTYPCTRRADLTHIFDNGQIVHRCKEHRLD